MDAKHSDVVAWKRFINYGMIIISIIKTGNLKDGINEYENNRGNKVYAIHKIWKSFSEQEMGVSKKGNELLLSIS